MDMYGLSAPDHFRIDDLLDFSNDDLFISSAATSSSSDNHPIPHTLENASLPSYPSISKTDLTADDLCVPTDDVAELEWLSRFVDDSFSYFPLTGTLPVRSDTAFSGRARTKRSRATNPAIGAASVDSTCSAASTEGGVRRCTHCASEKTPQWRTGPLGPKTLCNACGVRYKSGRLVPEYRPAASPTFVLTQHSNSHRKVMELRRQKEEMREQNVELQQEEQHHHQYRHQVF
ncbi:GATA transcription factor 4-like [Tripterygium wilfordii]|uniref:GATA transcription factor 4-like n=1 Tax=Tripterygium wilfordii TaxID=458696 RepID=UPI0018F84986|nr:GATA transcription factor 4-like [Tripterygium wilfordii]